MPIGRLYNIVGHPTRAAEAYHRCDCPFFGSAAPVEPCREGRDEAREHDALDRRVIDLSDASLFMNCL